jgi:hypothetical protein
MQDLSNLLGDLATEFPEEIEGKNANSGFDGPPLPSTRQYRATISRAEWRQAQSSGKWSYSITFEITEDPKGEFVGRKFSDYYNLDASAGEVGRSKFARLIGESGIDLKTADTSSEATFAKEFEGKNFVIATRIWGDAMDRNGIRYLNRDRGQKLLDNITPAPAELRARQGTSGGLKADIQIPKQGETDTAVSEPTGEEAESGQPVQETVRLPGTNTAPGGVRLPPGLRG